MKYTLHLNQQQLKELGIRNINQAHILDLITSVSSWATETIIDGKVYYWVARQHIAEELWILDLKPDTIYRHLKKLVDIGLIDYEKLGKKDCIRLTEKGKKYHSGDYVGNESEKGQNSEMNPNELGNESEKEGEKLGNESDITNTTISEPTTKLNQEAFDRWCKYKGKSYSADGKTLSKNKLEQYPYPIQMQMVEQSIMNNWQGLFDVNKQNRNTKQPEVGSLGWEMLQDQNVIDTEVAS